MKLRLSILIFLLLLLGVNSWGMSRFAGDDFSSQITFGISLLAITGICICLAWQSLNGLGAIKIFSLSSPLIFVQLFHEPSLGKTIIFCLNIIALGVFLYPRTVDVLARYIGAANEQLFLLRTPKSVTILTSAIWSFFWAVLYFIGINIEEKSIITALILGLFPIVTLVFFSGLTLNIIRRRLVVVPNGIVLCDPITLSDTILLPLSKLKEIVTIKLSDFATSHVDKNANEYIGNIGLGDVTQISLIEKTDSFIVRKNHAATERQDIDELFISMVNAKAFEKLFRDRFHGPEKTDPSTPLRSAQDDKGNSKPAQDDKENSSSAQDDRGNSNPARDDKGNSNPAQDDKGNSNPAQDDKDDTKRKDKIEMLKMEKELGIETAPKSDAKLPEWRKKTK